MYTVYIAKQLCSMLDKLVTFKAVFIRAPLSRIGMRKSLALLAACAASASAFAPIGCVPQLRIRARASFIARGTNRGRSAVLAPLHVRTCLGRKQKQAG